MIPSTYFIATSLPGSLILMPKPSGEWLKEDVKYLKKIGVNTVVSMLERYEATELQLDQENEICNQVGLGYIQFEIQDRGLPTYEPFREFINLIVQKIKNGETVAVHCRAGIGRSGMVVCCAMLHFGFSASEVITLVSKQRGVCVPDTDEQHLFIEAFEIKMHEGWC